ncbi:MAG TPA: hypothetical protein VJP02_03240 [Candidatus Sulfotelmatobacter sp.]|nr:hypothetical protein [Candidatus Sulfotelmatobacter sp.]
MKTKNWKELYATKVKPEEILYVVTNMTRLHEEGKKPNFCTAALILTDHYKGKRNAVEKVFVITERLQCLATLVKKNDERMRGWTMEAVDPDCMITNTAVFAATALCPLRDGENDRPNFDPDEFFQIVLRESESEGKA